MTNKVYLLMAKDDYETARVALAYLIEQSADTALAAIVEHEKLAPEWPGDNMTDGQFAAWEIADDAWIAGHPCERFRRCDKYFVMSMELLP